MKEFQFENQGTNTYLVYAIGQDDYLDTMSLGMLTNNKIPGMATTLFTQMDTTKYIKYNVSAKISVKHFFSGSVNKKRLTGVFNGIVDAMLSAEDYMIDMNSILLDLDYIFADVSTCETVLICLPIYSTDENLVDLTAFFKNIIFSTQFDQTENCDHVAKIINYLNSTPVFSLVDFKSLLDQIKNDGNVSSSHKSQPAQQARPVTQQAVATPTRPVVQQVSAQSPSASAQQPRKGTLPATPPMQAKPQAMPTSKKSVQQPIQPHPINNDNDTPKMSFMYLMQHYNSENAALYKAQKAARKAGNIAPVQQQKVANPPQQTPFKVPGAPAPNAGFAIPGQSAPSTSAQPAMQAATQKPISQHQATPMQQKVTVAVAPQPAYQPAATPQGQAMNFGETTVLGGGAIGETTVLNAGAQPNQIVKPHLTRAKNNEKILLDKPIYRIGKERSYVDYFIGDNTAISRSHANVLARDGEYFVVDTNSTNHTFVNGAMLQSNVEAKLEHGTKIRLANEEFEFKLY